jgi:hypothetical protein
VNPAEARIVPPASQKINPKELSLAKRKMEIAEHGKSVDWQSVILDIATLVKVLLSKGV